VLAFSGLDMLVQYANRFTVRTGEIAIEVPVLLFTIGIAIAVAVLLAWAPSLPGVQGLGNAAGAADSTRGVVGLSKKHLQRVLVVSQLSLSFTLLIGAGLMVRSLVNLTKLDTGITYENVVTMQAPNTTGMPGAENLLLMDQVVDAVRQFPGVSTVAHATRAPWSPNTVLRPLTVRVEGMDPEGLVAPWCSRTSSLRSISRRSGLRSWPGVVS